MKMSLRYNFAKANGILIVPSSENIIKIIYRADAKAAALREMRRASRKPLELTLVKDQEFNDLLFKNYEGKSGAASQLAEDISEQMDLQKFMDRLPKASDLLDNENSAPVINLINALFSEAIKCHASDIHLETFEDNMTARFRVHGVLQSALELHSVLAPLVISRIKVMAHLNIAEKRLPQDGRIGLKLAGASIDVRVSTIPTSHGERAVMRLLNKNAVHLKMEQLGMEEHLFCLVKDMIAKPHGIILVTGPTGSGKTTSLYAMLTALNVPGRNILTVEDPVEYDLPGVGQIQVNTKVDMTFARGLRAILRQDPNVIMVGEIRDVETASIAVQASLTGHLVLSTLHTNTAIGAITRLKDMGVEHFLLASSLIGVIAQRLVRVLCLDCRKAHHPSVEEQEFLSVNKQKNLPLIYSPVGCEKCNHTGFVGRTGIYEVMVLDAASRALIHDNSSETHMEKYIRSKFPSIRQDGARLILQGITSIEEVIRVTSE